MSFDRAYHVVVSGGLVCFGSSADGKVTALDAATGDFKWSFFTGGPVRFGLDTLRTADVRYFGETLTPAQLAGIGFTLAGIALLAKRRGTTPWVPFATGPVAPEASASGEDA